MRSWVTKISSAHLAFVGRKHVGLHVHVNREDVEVGLTFAQVPSDAFTILAVVSAVEVNKWGSLRTSLTE